MYQISPSPCPKRKNQSTLPDNSIKTADATNVHFVKDMCKGWDDRASGSSLHAVPRKAAPPASLLEHC